MMYVHARSEKIGKLNKLVKSLVASKPNVLNTNDTYKYIDRRCYEQPEKEM